MKTHIKIPGSFYYTFLIIVFQIAAKCLLAQAKPEFNQSKEIINDWHVPTKIIDMKRIESGTGIARAIYQPNYSATRAEPEVMAKQYLEANAQSLLLKSNINDLEHKKTIETPGGYKVHFKQMAGGYPVYGSEINVSINRTNEVVFVTSSYKPVGDIQTDINVTAEQAILTGKNHIGITGNIYAENAEKIIYQLNSLNSVVAYKVNIAPAEDHFGDWEIIVDAGTGEILRAEDKACYYHPDGDGIPVNGSGWVFDPDPITNSGATYGDPGFIDNNDADSYELTSQLSEVELENITFDLTTNLYSLVGPYAQIVDWQAPFKGLFKQAADTFHFTRSWDNFEAVNCYYHIHTSMKYLNEYLGFTIMPYRYSGGVKFDPSGLNGADNSIYHPYTGQLVFGEGGVDDAEDLAVILHELGHGIHDWITMGGISQVDGLSEGLSDYWAASYIRSFGFWEPDDEEYYWLGHWDGHNEFWPGRILNHSGHYPEAMNGQIHHDGQLWSSSLMSIYDLIGRDATDMNCWEGIAMLNGSSNQVDAAFAFAQADKELYNGAHLGSIYGVFNNRGYFQDPIYPAFYADQPNGEGPRVVTFTDNSFSHLGNIVSWQWDLNGDGQIDSYDQNPTFTYNGIGAYTISLTVSDLQNSHTLIKENYITVNGGFFVYEEDEHKQDCSGAYIRDFLKEQDCNVIYSNYFPNSLMGFEAVFLSFANPGPYMNQATIFNYQHSLVIQEYLEGGGKLYLEGGRTLYGAEFYIWPNKADLYNLFGISGVSINFVNPHPVNSLEGKVGSLAEGMLFTESNQVNNWYIDQIIPNASGHVAFYESVMAKNVAVYYNGLEGHKAFFSGYSLAELVDVDPHSSRYHLLDRIMDYFGYGTSGGYVLANFTVDEPEILPGNDVQFTDWSTSNTGSPITKWEWDFDGDGTIDSEDQNPVWSYNQGGNYDVTLAVSNGQNIDTLVREDAILVRSGIYVFDYRENGVDQSGTFIKDHLENSGYDVVYSNDFPASLTGFEAVFSSFGSSLVLLHLSHLEDF
jgi:PKD repeat protein